ncbi:glycoside hydrolase family 61 protein [Trametes elegans]|nr:glycoside hydrolase family 61 protein [Trametes elegans]
MLRLGSAFLLAALTALRVEAHGYVQDVVVGSQHYTGYLPYQDPYVNPPPERVIRKIPGNGPVEDVSLIDVQCNTGASPAPIFATVPAGSQVGLNWTTWPDSHVGPVITYLARAPSDITKWEPGTDAVWFKIDEAGKTVDGKWAATDVLTADHSVWSVTIPPKLKAGQYLLRHEIIALHSAGSYPGAQLYPACVQIEVTGSGDALPTTDLVAFPGAYTSDTPGIVFDVYSDPSRAYPIPGPAVWTGGN